MRVLVADGAPDPLSRLIGARWWRPRTILLVISVSAGLAVGHAVPGLDGLMDADGEPDDED